MRLKNTTVFAYVCMQVVWKVRNCELESMPEEKQPVLFWSFRYVRPEPVLVKCSFLCIWRKRTGFTHRMSPPAARSSRKRIWRTPSHTTERKTSFALFGE